MKWKLSGVLLLAMLLLPAAGQAGGRHGHRNRHHASRHYGYPSQHYGYGAGALGFGGVIVGSTIIADALAGGRHIIVSPPSVYYGYPYRYFSPTYGPYWNGYRGCFSCCGQQLYRRRWHY